MTTETVSTAKDHAFYIVSSDGKLDNSPRHSTPEAAWVEARDRDAAGQRGIQVLEVSLVGYITE